MENGEVGWCRSVGVDVDMDVSENSGISPQIIHFLIGFSITNHPFWGTTIFGNTDFEFILVAFELFELVFTVV